VSKVSHRNHSHGESLTSTCLRARSSHTRLALDEASRETQRLRRVGASFLQDATREGVACFQERLHKVLSLHNLRVRRRHARRMEWGVSSKVRPRPGGPVEKGGERCGAAGTDLLLERARHFRRADDSLPRFLRELALADLRSRTDREESRRVAAVSLHRVQDWTPRASLPQYSSRTFFWLPSSDAARATYPTLRPDRPRGGGGQGGAGWRTARKAAARMATCLTPPPARNMASRTANAGHARKAVRAAGQLESGPWVAYPTYSDGRPCRERSSVAVAMWSQHPGVAGPAQLSLDAAFVLHSPLFSPQHLVGSVLDGCFRLERHMAGCSGAYGHPFQGTELATGQQVFVKILCGPASGRGYSVARECDTVRALCSHTQRARVKLRPFAPQRGDASSGASARGCQ